MTFIGDGPPEIDVKRTSLCFAEALWADLEIRKKYHCPLRRPRGTKIAPCFPSMSNSSGKVRDLTPQRSSRVTAPTLRPLMKFEKLTSELMAKVRSTLRNEKCPTTGCSCTMFGSNKVQLESTSHFSKGLSLSVIRPILKESPHGTFFLTTASFKKAWLLVRKQKLSPNFYNGQLSGSNLNETQFSLGEPLCYF